MPFKHGRIGLVRHEKGKKHINLMEMQQRSTMVYIRTILSNSISSASQPATGSSISRSTTSASSNTGNISAGMSALVTRNDMARLQNTWSIFWNS